jgi:hypothetical protein
MERVHEELVARHERVVDPHGHLLAFVLDDDRKIFRNG